MSNNGYKANLGWLLASVIGLAPAASPFSRGSFTGDSCSRQPAFPVQERYMTRLPRVAASFRRLRAAFWFRSCWAPQLGQGSILVSAEASSRLCKRRRSCCWETTGRLPKCGCRTSWGCTVSGPAGLDIAASASALDCSPAFSMPDTWRWLFAQGTERAGGPTVPPWLAAEWRARGAKLTVWADAPVKRRHGRLERRELWALADPELNGYVGSAGTVGERGRICNRLPARAPAGREGQETGGCELCN